MEFPEIQSASCCSTWDPTPNSPVEVGSWHVEIPHDLQGFLIQLRLTCWNPPWFTRFSDAVEVDMLKSPMIYKVFWYSWGWHVEIPRDLQGFLIQLRLTCWNPPWFTRFSDTVEVDMLKSPMIYKIFWYSWGWHVEIPHDLQGFLIQLRLTCWNPPWFTRFSDTVEVDMLKSPMTYKVFWYSWGWHVEIPHDLQGFLIQLRLTCWNPPWFTRFSDTVEVDMLKSPMTYKVFWYSWGWHVEIPHDLQGFLIQLRLTCWNPPWFTRFSDTVEVNMLKSPMIYKDFWFSWGWNVEIPHDLQGFVIQLRLTCRNPPWFTRFCDTVEVDMSKSPMIYKVFWHSWGWHVEIPHDLQGFLIQLRLTCWNPPWFTRFSDSVEVEMLKSPMTYKVLWYSWGWHVKIPHDLQGFLIQLRLTCWNPPWFTRFSDTVEVDMLKSPMIYKVFWYSWGWHVEIPHDLQGFLIQLRLTCWNPPWFTRFSDTVEVDMLKSRFSDTVEVDMLKSPMIYKVFWYSWGCHVEIPHDLQGFLIQLRLTCWNPPWFTRFSDTVEVDMLKSPMIYKVFWYSWGWHVEIPQWLTRISDTVEVDMLKSPMIYKVFWYSWGWHVEIPHDLQGFLIQLRLTCWNPPWFTRFPDTVEVNMLKSPMIYKVFWHSWGWHVEIPHDLQGFLIQLRLTCWNPPWFTRISDSFEVEMLKSPMTYKVLRYSWGWHVEIPHDLQGFLIQCRLTCWNPPWFTRGPLFPYEKWAYLQLQLPISKYSYFPLNNDNGIKMEKEAQNSTEKKKTPPRWEIEVSHWYLPQHFELWQKIHMWLGASYTYGIQNVKKKNWDHPRYAKIEETLSPWTVL